MIINIPFFGPVDIIFWGPWAVGLVVFGIWVWQPVKEFKQMWDEQHKKHNAWLDEQKNSGG